ncbi:MAG: sugar phosphate nucleotidyltransferase [Zestosphaera sp.]
MGVLRIAVVPVGGEAVRLRPLTIETSKSMVRFLNKPLLELALLRLARSGIKEVYLGVRGYYNYRDLFDYFREGYWFKERYGLKEDLRIRYMPRYDTSGNADAVRIVMEYYEIKEPVVVIQGDNVFDLDVQEVFRDHVGKKAFMTIALKEVEDVRGFGVAEVGDDLRIKRFVEKPRPEEAPSKLVNTGIYVINAEIVEFFREGEGKKLLEEGRMDFGNDVIPELIKLGFPVYGYLVSSYWFDVGTPERYLKAMIYLLYSLRAEDLEAKEIYDGVLGMGKSKMSINLHETIRERILKNDLIFVGRALIGRHVSIGSRCFIEDSTIDNYVVVGNRCEIVRSAIMDRVRIGDRVRVVDSIIGRHALIGSNSIIINSVIGDNSVVGDNVRLVNVRVWPHEQVSSNASIENYVVKPHYVQQY